ncbi:MAG: hypothetical protein K6U75_05755 [Firmicutes bacterium]|nr:hypothetical protein [Bacillota bacterium]
MDTENVKRTTALLFSAVAAGYVLVATYPYGAGMTSDSIHYLTAARHLMQRGTLTTYTGEPLVSYAPLLSAVYALLGLTGIDLQLAARLVSAFSFAAVVWITWHWLHEFQIGIKAVWIGATLVLLARPLLWYAPYALSELPFIALTMGALWQSWRYAIGGRWTNLIASSICAGLSVLMRWIGVTTIGTISIFILLAGSFPWKKRLAATAGHLLVTLIPSVLWISRNHLLTGTLFGTREPADYPLREMVFDTLWSLHRWVVPFTFENSVPMFAVFVALGISLVGAAIRLQWKGYDAVLRKGLFLLLLSTGLYAIALMNMAREAKFEALSERLWSPIAVPLPLCLVLLWTLLQPSGSLARLARGALMAAFVGWYVSGFVFGMEMLSKCFQDGPGVFNTSTWRGSETIRWLRGHPLQGKVYSNFPEPLYYFSGIVSEHTPHQGPMRVASETHPRNLQQFLQKLRNDWKEGRRVYLIWFNNTSRSHYLCPLSELEQLLELRTVRRFPDGKILQFRQMRVTQQGFVCIMSRSLEARWAASIAKSLSLLNNNCIRSEQVRSLIRDPRYHGILYHTCVPMKKLGLWLRRWSATEYLW